MPVVAGTGLALLLYPRLLYIPAIAEGHPRWIHNGAECAFIGDDCSWRENVSILCSASSFSASSKAVPYPKLFMKPFYAYDGSDYDDRTAMILAGDIGGTKCNLGLFRKDGSGLRPV